MFKMNTRVLFTVAIACGAWGPSALAVTSADTACRGPLATLVNEWNAISFAPPSKPAQELVAGKGRHVTSAEQFNYMGEQIRDARAECDRGNAAAALQHITAVHMILDHSARPNG